MKYYSMLKYLRERKNIVEVVNLLESLIMSIQEQSFFYSNYWWFFAQGTTTKSGSYISHSGTKSYAFVNPWTITQKPRTIKKEELPMLYSFVVKYKKVPEEYELFPDIDLYSEYNKIVGEIEKTKELENIEKVNRCLHYLIGR